MDLPENQRKMQCQTRRDQILTKRPTHAAQSPKVESINSPRLVDCHDCINSIVFRAFQGLGGAGVFAINMTIFFELVRPEIYPTYASNVSVVFAVALLLGPILGGLINDAGAWRWVFLLK
ncbi:MAG: hypothetical protein L6R38_008199 [Xanthoria sp. 2 TBL-2021]|nr:MAG: hypothetical protein L6R38_008199 [Xanthoria sp. 2 TBL-2021]